MKCYHPITAYKTEFGVVFTPTDKHISHSIELPCGQCIGCRIKRSTEWQLRLMHERQLHEYSSCLTLTYSDEHLPAMGLNHRDVQLFLKRLRERTGVAVRYYVCGEYGEKNLRPHYHMCLYGLDFRADRKPGGKSNAGFLYYTSEFLNSTWQKGLTSIQDLTPETAAYCTKYVLKRNANTPEGHTPEYSAMSLKPAIGALWLKLYHRDVYPHDYAVLNGQKRPVPRYYRDQLKESHYDTDTIEYNRQLRAAKYAADNTPARLADQEIVATAKHNQRKRDLA